MAAKKKKTAKKKRPTQKRKKRKYTKKKFAAISVALLLTRQFHTPEEFSQHIMQQAEIKKQNHLETLNEYCQETGIEAEAAALLITDVLRNKIQEEVRKLHLLKE